TLHTIKLGLNDQIRAQAVVRAYGTATPHFPGTCRELERFGQQGPHRADVDHVAGKFRLDRLADKRRDLGKFAAIDHADFHDAADLLAEAHAACAMDAALHAVGRDEGAHGLGDHHALFFLIA